MKEFYTRQKAGEGVKLPLYLPDGTLSKHWITVRGVDSDEFRVAETKAKRKAVDISQIEGDAERDKVIRQTELETIAALVVNWSFEQPCTKEEVVHFLTEAPQISDMINRFAASRSAFFGKKSEPSVSGRKKKSSSRKPQKAQE